MNKSEILITKLNSLYEAWGKSDFKVPYRHEQDVNHVNHPLHSAVLSGGFKYSHTSTKQNKSRDDSFHIYKKSSSSNVEINNRDKTSWRHTGPHGTEEGHGAESLKSSMKRFE